MEEKRELLVAERAGLRKRFLPLPLHSHCQFGIKRLHDTPLREATVWRRCGDGVATGVVTVTVTGGYGVH